MIISQTPFRISFVGGGTDFEDFYRQYPGRVLSTTINKYIYITINPKFDGSIRLSYSRTENVENYSQIEHPLVRTALEEIGIKEGIEIASVADIPGQGSGLGSSSSFTVGLLNGLYSFLGKNISSDILAEKACQVEIKKIGSPIGKQDQYAAAFGNLNLITFNTDGKIKVEPISLSLQLKENFQNHLLLFYTGLQRSAGLILSEQKKNIEKKLDFLKKMSEMVLVFKTCLEKGDFQKIGEILNQGWLLKKELSSKISNPQIDEMYNLALETGAWGGKILGAGGGGFLLVMAPLESQPRIKQVLKNYKLVPFRFSGFGSRIIFKN